MISVGIFNGYFPYNMEESIKRIKALGFTSVQLDLSFKGMDLSFSSLTPDKCHFIRDSFRDANLPIVAISGYTNLVHPNLKKREENIANLKTLLRFARDLGSPYVVSETGTFDEESDWVYHPKNGTEEAYETLCTILSDVTKFAYDHGSVFLVENYVNNIIGTVDQLLRLFSDMHHSSI
ncbi:MAG TPA: TIM barrel protein, partial [Bacteroidales bacterium]|nr:TIM barrel protein [Bacteroidales bacterium]